MENVRIVPNLRFKFNTNWQIKKGTTFFINSRAKGNELLPIYSVTLDRGMVSRDSLERKMGNDAKASANLFVAKNDISYNMMRMWQGAYGLAPKDCMVSPAYVVLRPKSNVCPEFFIHLFSRERSLFLFTAYSYGLTSDRLRLYFKDFSNIKFAVPEIDEQKKIADFLTSVDLKIQHLNKKKALLKQYKKGVMQQIFNQDIRFKDETGNDYPDWEEKMLGDVFQHRVERNAINGELLSVSINNGVQRHSDLDRDDNSSSDKSKYLFVKAGDIVYNSMRMWQGASGQSLWDGIVSPAYTVLSIKENYDVCFFAYMFKQKLLIQKFQKHSQGLTSDTWNLKYDKLKGIKVRVPRLSEQVKIANFLSSIDQRIELISRQLNRTQEFKKGLLQQMFI